MSLLTDLIDAQAEPTCPLCDLINSHDGLTAEALADAAAGSMGVRKLAVILRRNDTGIGERVIKRHRLEGHTP